MGLSPSRGFASDEFFSISLGFSGFFLPVEDFKKRTFEGKDVDDGVRDESNNKQSY